MTYEQRTRTIVVTGATGTVGRHLVEFLRADGRRVRALTRDPGNADLPVDVERHVGSPAQPDTVGAAADGADAAFLLWPSFDATGADATVTALAAAVDHVVYLSAADLQGDRSARQAGVWAEIEDAIVDAGVRWTFLRAGGFAANTLGWADAIRSGDTVAIPYPEGTRSLVHEADIAEAAWHALVDPRHHGAAYDITGPQQLTQRRQVALIADALGRHVRVREQEPDEARAELTAMMGAEFADASLQYWATLTTSPERVSDDVERITGHPARTFAQWAVDHVDDFRRGDADATPQLRGGRTVSDQRD